MVHFKVFTGPMFGGKTTSLLSAIERDVIRGLSVISFKPKIDNRYSDQKITTHLGATVNAQTVSSGIEILNAVEANENKIHSIAIDELFMIPMAGPAAIKLFRRGINVYVSSLQLSSKPDPYEEMLTVLPWATDVVVCPAVCVSCRCMEVVSGTVGFKDGDLVVVIGTSFDVDGKSCKNMIIAQVVGVGLEEIFLKCQKTQVVFKRQATDCHKIPSIKNTGHKQPVPEPKLGDLVLSYCGTRFTKEKKVIGILIEIIDKPPNDFEARLLCGEETHIVSFKSLITIQEK
jgi:thymidine kinase